MGQAVPGRSILIVEDEAIVRHDMIDFFEERGFRVFDAGDADEAITVLEANPGIEILFTDVQMPGSMDGLRLARYVRDRYPPIILIVASGAVKASEAGLPDQACFLPKPYDPRTVLREIERLMN